MKNSLKEALKANATFVFDGSSNSSAAKKVAILPGIYDTMKQVTDGTSKETVITLSNPANLVNAGYSCDQVADDYNSADSSQVVHISGSNRTKVRDFLHTVQRVGIKVTKIIIQNMTTQSGYKDLIFDQEIELARTAVGAKGAMDFINLQNYIDVNAYDRSKITIDLSDEPLYLTPEVYMAITVPVYAKFSMQFVFEA